MTRSKLYSFIFLFSIIGYIWLAWNLKRTVSGINHFSFCIFKQVTGLPCPSCGTTRGTLLLAQGNLWGAMHANPLSFIVSFGLLVFPIWVIFDLCFKKYSFYQFYLIVETSFKKKIVAAAGITIIAIIWIMNIYKGL
jgi:hypothetical protein